MRNLRIDLCYDGTRYQGWQRLPKTDNTIQGKLETALSRILGEQVEVTGSGRTDAGVHALRQVANVHCGSTMPCEDILSQLRRYLPEDIGIYSVRNVSERFHARLNAKRKTYQYNLWYSDAPCVFKRKYVTFYPAILDLAAMKEAAALLVGTHDFSAFCASGSSVKTSVRTVYYCNVTGDSDHVEIRISADGFLYNMVRIIAGTLVAISEEKLPPDAVSKLLATGDRTSAGITLPPCGLRLEKVWYGDKPGLDGIGPNVRLFF